MPSLDQLLESGIRAPSGDNSQPWSFEIGDSRIRIRIHPELDHALLNVDNAGTLISAGAVIENISLAASAGGSDTEVVLFPEEGNPQIAAEISLKPSLSIQSVAASAIYDRHTNRRPFSTNPLPQDFCTTIGALEIGSAKPHLIEDRLRINTIAQAASAMEEAALSTKQLHRLFFDSIIWRKADAGRGAPGLPLATLELPPPARIAFRIIRYWGAMRALKRIGFPAFASRQNAAVYEQCGAIVGISVPAGPTPQDYIHAGRLMERVWLIASAARLAVQPLAGLLYLAKYAAAGHDGEFDPPTLSRIQTANEAIRDGIGCGGSRDITMLLRIGIPMAPATAKTTRAKPRKTLIQST